MIDAINLTKKFGDVTAVDDLTFHVNEGEASGFLGPDGAGKKQNHRLFLSRTSWELQLPEDLRWMPKKDENGRYLPLTFPKRVFIFVLTLLVVMNIGVFYFHEKVSFSTVLGVTIFGIVFLVIFFAFWVPRYSRIGAQVKW
jgi:hypothetical protein